VLGTLFDQLTYPETAEHMKISKEAARTILEKVDLAYLADRAEVFEKETNWEQEISLGEKQRLAIARLIFHDPKFAILDECTSAVSTKMEERLYWMLAKEGITYITISHRPTLETFHLKKLCINGDEDKTYTYESLQTVASLEAHVEQGLKVRKPPSWPRSWASFSLSPLYSHRNAWANLRLLGQPDSFFAQGAGQALG
jgi:ABC-type uncharacterized transport system fused permease/ATPase subunit